MPLQNKMRIVLCAAIPVASLEGKEIRSPPHGVLASKGAALF